jgi:two-component system response regulator HydG
MDVNSSAVLPPATGIICLLDDDPSMLRALDRLLSSAGLQAQLFSEPLVFLSYVICNSVALAIIDIWMSGMSGLEVQKELQTVSPTTRVIISTANDHDSVRNAAIQAGAIAYFIKPFDDRRASGPARGKRVISDVGGRNGSDIACRNTPHHAAELMATSIPS